MKKVCVLTTFDSYDPSYSLNLVAETQVKMLVAGGYEPVVIVNEGFEPVGGYALPGVLIEKVPHVHASNDGILPENWGMQRDMLEAAYRDAFDRHGIEVVITHDLIAQAAALIPNLAARRVAAERPNVRWLHWVHSVFSSNMPSNVLEASKEGRAPWPNSKIVFPNEFDRPRVARSFHVDENDVAHCPHPTDIEDFMGLHPVIARLCKEKGILNKKALMTYPCRLDRGKQPHIVIEIAAALKRLGTSVAFVCMDFSSTGGDKVAYREDMKKQAKNLGLDDTDVIFLSEFDDEFKYHAPRGAVRQLFSLSNVMILPSVSETYSLVAQEAALCGNFLILNYDFPPIRSVYGEAPKYFKFSSNIDLVSGLDGNTKTEYGNRDAYMEDVARYVNYQLTNNRVLAQKTRIRTERSLEAVLKNFLTPLLYGDEA